jgi:hypothetical protein
MTPWYDEVGVINWTPGALRLSGFKMRMHLYFATAPGNQMLYISEKKHGIIKQLPTH